MTLEQINYYFSEVFKKNFRVGKGSVSKNILTAHAETIAKCIVEQPQKNETIKILLNNRPEYIKKFFNMNYISVEEIAEIGKTNPEIYYVIPETFYSNNPQLFNMIAESQNILFDLLPKEVKNNEMIQNALKRKKSIYYSDKRDINGYDIDWLDENGKLINFFTLANNYVINSKEDYLKIVEKYLSSGMSVPLFCKQYGISSVDGFNKLLNRVGIENIDTQDSIDEVKDRAKQIYLGTIKNIANQINEGKLTFKEYIDSNYNQFHKFKLLIEYISDKQLFMKQLIDYICNEQLIKIDRLNTLFETDSRNIVNAIKPYLYKAGINDANALRGLHQTLNRYKYPYKRCVSKIIKNGVEYNIDDSVIDKALVYLHNNDIYKCQYTVDFICKKIAMGEINYDVELEEKKEELKTMILYSALEKAKSIDDYLTVMDENNKHRTI